MHQMTILKPFFRSIPGSYILGVKNCSCDLQNNSFILILYLRLLYSASYVNIVLTAAH